MASASVLSPGEVSPGTVKAAAPLPDIMPPVKVRRGLWGFMYRNPSIAIGGTIVLLMVLMAIFAPLLTYADPTALAYLASATIHTLAHRARSGQTRAGLDALVAATVGVICRA